MRRGKSAYDDDTLMPFGRYKGQALEDIPGAYFLALEKHGISDNNLQLYIDENRSFLEADDNYWDGDPNRW